MRSCGGTARGGGGQGWNGRSHGGGIGPGLIGDKGQKSLHRRKLARDGTGRDLIVPQIGHPGAQIGLTERGQRGKPGLAAVMMGQKVKKLAQIAGISGQRVVGGTFQRAQMIEPARQGLALGRRNRQPARGHDNQRRMVRSNIPAKKARRSVPWVGLN
jgi:hypothetical protein